MWPFDRRELKDHPSGAGFMVSSPVRWGGWGNRAAYVKEGYSLNAVVYRCVEEITAAATTIELDLVDAKGDKIERHPVLDLLARPNPRQSWDKFLVELLTNDLLFGEQIAVAYGGPRPGELWAHDPRDVAVKPGPGGTPSAFIFDRAGTKKVYPVQYPSGASEVFFNRRYSPDDYWRGLSPLSAARLAVDVHNEGLKWNWSLLKNSARPSGMIKFKDAPSAEVLQRLKTYFKETLQGSANAGEVPILIGDAEWNRMDMSPRDMDHGAAMAKAEMLIAMAYNVPLSLVSLDAATFSNMAAAREALYTNTVVPLMRGFAQALGSWLLPAYGAGLSFAINTEATLALEPVRQRTFDRAMRGWESGVLTREEARRLIGRNADPGAGEEFKPQPGVVSLAEKAYRLAYG